MTRRQHDRPPRKTLQDLTGQTLGDYQVLRRIGRGAMAEVYLAQQQSLDRQVALKVLNAELARDDAYVSRFQHEARAAAALVHANIVQVYEVGVVAGRHFIAQEYVAGNNLGELIHRQGRLEPGVVLDILRQVATALCRASEANIVHRDIKPENLMFARSGEVKVADFGLARAGQGGAPNLTQAGVTMGTPLYMSPEQVEGRPVDTRSDLYSLGVTAYQMLSGGPPFEGETPLSVAVQHLNTPPPPLVDRQPDAPLELCRIIERMMAKSPNKRHASPVQLLSELRSLAAQAAEEGWAAGPENWSVTETLALSQPLNPSTERLNELMTETASLKSAHLPRGRRWILLAVIGCLLGGALLAAVTRPKPLLSATAPGPTEKETVLEQLFHAKLLDSEEAWKIILQRFPDADDFYRNQAKLGLARLYLNRGNFAAARPLCLQLAALDHQEAFQLFGQAASVVCDVELGQYVRARRALENGSLIEKLPQLQRTEPNLHAQFNSARERLPTKLRGE